MNDPYEKVWESIEKALSAQSKMVLWIAERTLSAKDFKELVDEFAKKPKDNHDELLDFIRKEGLRDHGAVQSDCETDEGDGDMSDREKVIKGLEHCIRESEHIDDNPCDGCPYFVSDQYGCERTQMEKDALAMLKEQEPVPYEMEGGGYNWYPVCGECHGVISDQDSFCRHCGTPVKKE